MLVRAISGCKFIRLDAAEAAGAISLLGKELPMPPRAIIRKLRKRHFARPVLFALAAVLGTIAARAFGEVESVYVTSFTGEDDIGTVRRTSDFAPSTEELVATGTEPAGIDLDVSAGKVYWADAGAQAIRRSNLNGSNVEDLVTGLDGPRDISLDLPAVKMYWTDFVSGTIQRSNLDGSAVEDVVVGLVNPVGVTVVPEIGKVYWTDYATDKIQRANLDGSAVEDVFSTTPGLLGPLINVAVDVVGGKIYFTDPNTYAFMQADLDGGNAQTILTTTNLGLFLDVAPSEGKLYWSTPTTEIFRCNLDGTLEERVLVASGESPFGIAYDPVSSTMYWSEYESDEIRRRALPDVETLVSGLGGAGGIDLELVHGTMYWADWDAETIDTSIIWRADLDGQHREALLTDLRSPFDVEIDHQASVVYWSDYVDGTIYRMGLDGGDVQPAVSQGASGIVGIALDELHGMVYWADFDAGTIRRAGLNGLNIETLVTGLAEPFGVAVDPVGGKVYWGETDNGFRKIQRANLDGSGVEAIVPVLDRRPVDLQLDVPAGKIYWSNYVELQRANLDGSDVEIVTELLFQPAGIALRFPVNMDGSIASNIPPDQIHEGEHLILTAPEGFSYQWRRDGENIPFETGATLEFDSVELDDSGTYDVMYEDGAKAPVQSEPFELSVHAAEDLPLSWHYYALLALSLAVFTVLRQRAMVSTR